MISQSEQERLLYQSRLKAQRDAAWRLRAAEEEGLKKGREEGIEEGESRGEARGEQIGRIRTLQQLLGISEATGEELRALDLPALEAMAADLQAQLRPRN